MAAIETGLARASARQNKRQKREKTVKNGPFSPFCSSRPAGIPRSALHVRHSPRLRRNTYDRSPFTNSLPVQANPTRGFVSSSGALLRKSAAVPCSRV